MPDTRGLSMVGGPGARTAGQQGAGSRGAAAAAACRLACACEPWAHLLYCCSWSPTTLPAQVAKHLEKQQKDKEARAMERLHLLLPTLGTAVRALALQQCNWDEERALTMLRRFQVGGAGGWGCLLG